MSDLSHTRFSGSKMSTNILWWSYTSHTRFSGSAPIIAAQAILIHRTRDFQETNKAIFFRKNVTHRTCDFQVRTKSKIMEGVVTHRTCDF